MWPCRLHVMRVSAGGVQLAGVKRGRQDADAAALRRATHSTFISSRARASSCRKYQDACLLRRAPSAGPSVACLATEVVTRSSTMALAPSAVGTQCRSANIWSIGMLLSLVERQWALLWPVGRSDRPSETHRRATTLFNKSNFLSYHVWDGFRRIKRAHPTFWPLGWPDFRSALCVP